MSETENLTGPRVGAAEQEATRPLEPEVELKSPELLEERKQVEGHKQKQKMEDFASTAYQSFEKPSTDEPSSSQALPERFKTKGNPEKARARAEIRRTRRTMRLQQQQQQKQEEKQRKIQDQDAHYKISYSSESSDSSIDENYDVASIAESENESLTWRGRMQHALHNQLFHIVIVVLVSLDALIVIFELLIDVGAFGNVRCEGANFLEQAENCHYRDRSMCGPNAKLIIMRVNISESHGGNGANEDICRCGFRGGNRVCIPFYSVNGVNPALVLHIFSLIILTTFLGEIILKFIAFRLKYFTHKFEVFDGAIVVISWILDVSSVIKEEAFEAAALLIVLRLWRVIRIVNGAVLSSKSQADKDLEERREEARKIIHAFHKAQDKMDDVEGMNIDLEKKIKKLENGRSQD